MATGQTWRFRKGDIVPPWMMDNEPVTAGAKQPSVTFGGDVIVVETDYAFWILIAGQPPGDAEIVVNGATGGIVKGFPTNKPLIWATQMKILRPPGDERDVEPDTPLPRMPESV